MLSTVTLFDDLLAKDREELSAMMRRKVFSKNQLIISQGDNTRSLFVILSGRLKVFVNDELGNQTVFAFLQQGDYCGELSLLDAEPRSASIITLEKTEVLELSHRQFDGFVRKHPDACFAIFKSLTAMIREMDKLIATLNSKGIYGRLVHVLYKEAYEENGMLMTPRLTHQDLAEMIGASREMVTRVLNELRNKGYITIRNKHIYIEKELPENG